MKTLLTSLAIVLLCFNAEAQRSDTPKKMIRGTYEEVDFEDLMHRYFGKAESDPHEGIYSVSCVIVKRSKKFLSKRENIKVMARKDNYARVAILRDWPSSTRDYIEVSLSYRDAKKYPIMGKFDELAEGRTFIYRHFEPDGSHLDFSFVNESPELLEGEFSRMKNRRTITYKLSYMRIYPKSSELMIVKDE